jgi:hypothetical protein
MFGLCWAASYKFQATKGYGLYGKSKISFELRAASHELWGIIILSVFLFIL